MFRCCRIFLRLICLALPLPAQAAAVTNGADPTYIKPWFDGRLRTFFVAKEKQAHELANTYHLKVAPDIWSYFSAGENGQWQNIPRLYYEVARRSHQYTNIITIDPLVANAVWPTVHETELAYNQFSKWPEKYCLQFAGEIINSIPPGSLYFGGTEPGRGLITAICKSQPDADPFVTLTQNALADSAYMEYIRAMYGSKINLPTESEVQKAFADYLDDAVHRTFENKLKPGEHVTIVDGKPSAQGIPAMGINALILRTIFDKNPDREFFVEQSYPIDWLDWTYAYLTPHRLILKLNHTALNEISAETIRQDHEYWIQLITPILGDWLHPDTSLKTVTEFADRLYRHKNYTGFKGDTLAITNEWSRWTFAKSRATIATLYAWRADQSTVDLKTKMAREADFAFRQAFALYPPTFDVISPYTTFLQKEGRLSDLRLILQTAMRIAPEKSEEHKSFRDALNQLKKGSPEISSK